MRIVIGDEHRHAIGAAARSALRVEQRFDGVERVAGVARTIGDILLQQRIDEIAHLVGDLRFVRNRLRRFIEMRFDRLIDRVGDEGERTDSHSIQHHAARIQIARRRQLFGTESVIPVVFGGRAGGDHVPAAALDEFADERRSRRHPIEICRRGPVAGRDIPGEMEQVRRRDAIEHANAPGAIEQIGAMQCHACGHAGLVTRHWSSFFSTR